VYRLLWMASFSLATLVLPGCGDDNLERRDGGADASPGLDGPSSSDGAAADFSTPAGFDRSGCTLSGWDALALNGTIWSIDHDLPALGRFAGVVRFDAGLSGAMVATYNGGPATRTLQTAQDLFWYRAPTAQLAERALLGCTRPQPGVIDGLMASCDHTGTCSLGTFHAVRLERLLERPEGEHSPNVTLLAEFPGPGGPVWPSITANVRVDGARQLAVLARYGDGLRILALDPGPPYTIRELSHVDTEETLAGSMNYEIYNDVKLFDAGGKHYALMASNRHGIIIFDITDPAHPVRVGHLRDGENVHTHFFVGTTLYLADLEIGGLVIADLSNPEAPVELGQYILEGAAGDVFVHDLYVEPGRAYLDYWGAGLVIVDVTDPAAPHKLGQFTYDRMTNHSNWVGTLQASDGAHKICLTGDEDFTAHARELDVTDPANIHLVGEYGQERPQVSIHNILVDGDKAYVAWYMDGLRILQLSVSAPPALVGWFNSWRGDAGDGYSFYDGAIGLDKVGELIYLADESRGLLVLQVP
jgi:hypothetical protein